MLENEQAIAAVRFWSRTAGMIEIRSRGTSMYPFIREGDICTFLAAEEDNRLYHRGDILLIATRDGRLVGHRLHQVERSPEGERYRLKGDSNLLPDAWAEPSQIIGRLVSIKRRRKEIRVTGLGAIVWGRLMIYFPRLSKVLRLVADRLPVRRQRA